MAIYCATPNDFLQRLTGLLPLSSPAATRMIWTRNRSVIAAPPANCAYAAIDDLLLYTQAGGLFTDASTLLANLYVQDGAAFDDALGPKISTNVYTHLTWTTQGTLQTLWVNAIPVATVEFDLSAAITGIEVLGSDGGGTDHDLAYQRSWAGLLRQGEIQREMMSRRAIRRANLWQDCPLEDHYDDVSGNGRHWTPMGTLAFSDNPTLLSQPGVSDQDFFSTIQRKLLEPANGGASFFSGHWTAAELLASAQDRQDALLRETHLQIGVARIDETAGQGTYDLPDDWIATVAVVRVPPTGRAYLVDLSDSFDSDMGQRTWDLASGRPTVCRDVEGQTRVLQLMPAPSDAGYLLVYYVPHSARLTGQGEVLTVPNELGLPVLQYGVLGDLLAKVGRGADRARAQYCQQRWQLGVEVTEILLKGLM